jgi:AcrR family transcriptional regulator
MNVLEARPSSADSSSQSRILDAAEHLFARHGFEATSVRAITAEAGVHLSAVNYHFGSKDRLIVAVLRRAIQPLNATRYALLDTAVAACTPKPVPLARLLDTMLRPCLEISLDPNRQQLFHLLERSMSEQGNFIEEILKTEWLPVINRYMVEFRRTLPRIQEKDIYWRIHFTVGALVHAARHGKDLELISKGTCRVEAESCLQRLIEYACAGLQAPRSP